MNYLKYFYDEKDLTKKANDAIYSKKEIDKNNDNKSQNR